MELVDYLRERHAPVVFGFILCSWAVRHTQLLSLSNGEHTQKTTPGATISKKCSMPTYQLYKVVLLDDIFAEGMNDYMHCQASCTSEIVKHKRVLEQLPDRCQSLSEGSEYDWLYHSADFQEENTALQVHTTSATKNIGDHSMKTCACEVQLTMHRRLNNWGDFPYCVDTTQTLYLLQIDSWNVNYGFAQFEPGAAVDCDSITRLSKEQRADMHWLVKYNMTEVFTKIDAADELHISQLFRKEKRS